MAHEFDGRRYAQASAHQQEWGTRLIDELELDGDEHVLDLGCGDGRVTAALAARLPCGRVVGIDASEGMIETAREHSAPNLEFVRMDIARLGAAEPFAGAFHIVVSNAALHWVKDHARLLRDVHRALRPGGLARFSFAGEGNCANLYAVVRDVMALDEFAGCFDNLDWPWFMPGEAEYRLLLADTPFARAEAWTENADRHFADAAAMTRWIDQPCLVPFLAHLDEARRRPFRNLVVARMVGRARQPDGTCFETFRRLNVAAVRAG